MFFILLGSFKRNNAVERFDYYPPEERGSVVALIDGYPKTEFDEDTLMAVDQILMDDEKTKKVCFRPEEGHAKAQYFSNVTRMYLLRTDSNSIASTIYAKTGIKIKFLRGEYFWKKIILSCEVNKHVEDHEFITSVDREGTKSSSRYEFEECEYIGQGRYKVYFGVTPSCYQKIVDKKLRLKVGKTTAKVSIHYNPFPELFGDVEEY